MKISSIIVTQIKRIDLLEKSLWFYSRQTLDKTCLELLIVHHDGLAATEKISSILKELSIEARILHVEKRPLGALRNIGLRAATGDIICQWDDDDLCSPDRLKCQSSYFSNSEILATTLHSQICWFSNLGELYIRTGGREGIHGTIMFRNGLNLFYSDNMDKGEDTCLMTDILRVAKNGVYCIDGHPELYLRTYHGNNTWNFAHHYGRLKHQAMPEDWLLTHRTRIIKWIQAYDLTNVIVKDNLHNTIFHVKN